METSMSLNGHQALYWGPTIQYIVEAMDIKISMLASLLAVSEKTLRQWMNEPIYTKKEPKINRIKNLYRVVYKAGKNGLRGKILLSFINEPIPGEGETSLLHYIVDDLNMEHLNKALRQALPLFIQNK